MKEDKAQEIDKKNFKRADKHEPENRKECGEISIEMVDHIQVGEIEFEGEEPAKPSEVPEEVEAEDTNEEAAKWKDAALRRLAELENFRKRVEKEKEELRSVTICEIGKLLAPIMDDIDRACGYQYNEGDEAIQQVFPLLKAKMERIFTSLGIEAIVPLRESFDPAMHEAIMSEPKNDIPPNQVTEVLLTGYRLGKKLIRAAGVKVSRKDMEG